MTKKLNQVLALMLTIAALATGQQAWADYLYLEINPSDNTSATMKYGGDYYGPYYDERADWWYNECEWNGKGTIKTITVDGSCLNVNYSNLSGLFCEFTSLETINNIGNLNSSNVTDMSRMFVGCSSLTTLDLRGWNTSNVTDMSHMFKGCSLLATLYISGWDMSEVTNTISMFEGCSKLASISFPASLTSIGSYAFDGCTNLTTVTLNSSPSIGTGAFPDGATVTIASGLYLYNGTEVLSGTITDMTKLNGKTLTPAVPYIDANGTTAYCTDFTVLDGTETRLPAGWYVVNDNITHTGTVTLDGDVTIILANGKTMNIGTSESPVTGNGINGFGHSLTIYGQTLDEGTAGQLRIYTSYTRFGTAGILSSTYTQHSGNVTINSYGNNALAGSNITINGGKLDATASTGASSSDVIALAGSSITINGGTVTATGIQYNDASADGIYCTTTLTLGWRNASDQIYASSYTGTVTIADGQVFTDGSGNNFYGTIADVSTIAGKTLQPVTNAVPYVDADGTTAYCTSYTELTGSETMLAPGWYVVNSDITYDHNLELSDEGTVNIILADGKTMTINLGQYDNPGIRGIAGEKNLTIYGQTAQDGTLRITAVTGGIYCGTLTINSGTVNVSSSTSSIYATRVIINGGVVTATANGKDVNNPNGSNLLCYSIFSSEGVSINGGQVTATGNSGRIASGNSSDITLGYTKATDFISFKRIDAAGEVKIANDKSMTDGTNIYNSSTSSETLEALTNVTLRPFKAITLADNADNTSAISGWNGGVANVTLSGRTLWKDGAWNTLCLPFDVSTTSEPLSGDNVKAMVLRTSDSGLSGTTLTLNFDAAPATIPAGTPFIVKWDNTGENITNPVFNGVTIDKTNRDVAFTSGWFKGTYEKMAFAEENKSILFVGDDNNLHWPKEGASLGACRAYFELSDVEPGGGGGNAPELRIVLNFGEEEKTGISSLTPDPSPKGKGSDYYTLDGRKLNAKPMKKGLYIHNGRKVVIK